MVTRCTLWWTDLTREPVRLECLLPAEIHRAERLAHAPARRRFLARRTWLRWVMDSHAVRSWADTLRCDPDGRLHLDPGMAWSASSAADLAVLLLTGDAGPAGVDVELRTTTHQDPRTWTRQEATLKALGWGLERLPDLGLDPARHLPPGLTLYDHELPEGFLATACRLPPVIADGRST